MSYYYVCLGNVPGVAEFDSTHARALASETPGAADVETVVEANGGEEAIRIARQRWGGEQGRLEALMRVEKFVLPRLAQPAREGDTTLGEFHRRGPRLRVVNLCGMGIDVVAHIQAWEWGRVFVLEGVELEVWRLGERPAPMTLAPGEVADCKSARSGDPAELGGEWNCWRCGQHGLHPESICPSCGWWDCGHRSTDVCEDLPEKCSNWLCLAGKVADGKADF